MKALFITGHRQLPKPYTWLKQELVLALERAVLNDFDTVICGGALGGDWLAAETVLELRPAFYLWLALPFVGYNSLWRERVRSKFETTILNRADKVTYVSEPPFTPRKMFIRNEWGVDNSEAVIAIWVGRLHGGTAGTVKYAQAREKPIYLLNPQTEMAGWLK